jgi:hypothetical protein
VILLHNDVEPGIPADVDPVNDVSRADETRLTNKSAVQGHDRL